MRADSPAFSPVRLIALVSGLLAALCAVLAPLLPVREDRATLDWPQPQAVNVDAPLVSYVPNDVNLSIPCTAIRDLPGGTVLSTVPAQAPGATAKGLVAKVSDESGEPTVSVVQRDIPVLSAPLADIADCDALTVDSTAGATTAAFTGAHRDDGTEFRNQLGGDIRPQVVGVFTDLDRGQLGDAHLHADIDSRFSSSPGWMKLTATVAAVLLTIVSLICLHLIDTADGRRPRRVLPARWWRFGATDVVVLGTLLVWQVIGANTSDDGYILNMARTARHSGYMANYYRWFGVAEAPFGWPYEVLSWMTRVSDASWWMRLPALLAGMVCWLVISREVLPRLGARVRRDAVARWTAGLVFLAAWLPYDNGLRPEPLIAAGALLTWCSIERSIATGRLLPAALAVLIAAFSLAAGPTGLICIAALIAGSRPVLQLILQRARGRRDSDAPPGPSRNIATRWGAVLRYGALLAPGVAAGLLVLVVVFADQTLATVMEATRVRKLVGPDQAWFDERIRWDSLMMLSPDGSLARRFGILGMLLCLGVCVLVMLRKHGRVPGTSRGPSARILGIVFMSLVLMMFTPTKWTHHFGVYAGLAGSLAALTAVAVGSNGIRARYNRSLFAASVLFLLALTFTGSNGWWYVSSYGIPWWDKAPMVAGKGMSTLFLGLAVLALLLAAWQYYREPYRKPAVEGPRRRFDRIAIQPLTIAAAAMVLFEVASLSKAAVAQYPAYSNAKTNLSALGGHSCSLADNVLVETNTPDSLLQPITGAPADGLSAENTGFTPNGVANDLTADAEQNVSGGANSVDPQDENKTTNTTQSGTGGGQVAEQGINGSKVQLPFGLDPARTPVMGNFTTSDKQQAHLTSQWYGLDADAVRNDPAYRLLVLSAAGRIQSVSKDGTVTYGQKLRVEFGRRGADGSTQTQGSFEPFDIGGAPSWRNLRVPMDQVPDGTTAVRIVAVADDLTPEQWLAVTPPRLPRLQTLDSVVGHRDPVLADWHVGLAFPCQHPFDHRDGVAEVPRWRIIPDRNGAEASNHWEDDIGGGPLGWTDLMLRSETVPGYSNDDWTRDWGSLQRLTPYVPDTAPATVGATRGDRWGWTKGIPIRAQ